MKNQNQDRNWRQNESNQRNQNQFSRNRQWENQNNAWQQHQPEHRDPWQSDYREYPAEQQRDASFGQHENYSSPYRGNQGNNYRVNDNDNYNQAGIYGNQNENDRDRGYNTSRYQQDNRQQYYRGQQSTPGNDNRYGNEYNTSDHSMFRGNESTKQYQGNNQWGSNEGNYRGYGPKSYKRSDERIHEDINDLLTNHSLINAYDVDVKVNNGDVVLEGSVESRNAKRMIEDIVEDVSGVKNVENRLRISNGMEVNPEGGLDSADRRKPEKTTANK